MNTATTYSQTPATSAFDDIYEQVTDIIIQQLEAGTIPWQKPWTGNNNKMSGLPYNFTTDKYYNGINIILLWCAAIQNNYQTNEWAGFLQWAEKKEAIRKGEKGNTIVFYDTFEKEVDGEIKKIPFLKLYKVFNRSQLASYVPEAEIEQVALKSLVEKIEPIDVFLGNTSAIIEQHDGGACYIPSSDKIQMPFSETFHATETCTATEGFYSSVLHELVHWSGAKHRLNRQGGKRFGDQAYAVEELTAEFGAAFLCAGFGIATIEKGDHAAYIDNWLKVLKENNRCIFAAAGEASKAVEYLKGLQPE